jgi:hypothetical protein
MDQFFDRHPYRCLPLNIANAHGWELLCPTPIEVEWNGGPHQRDLTVRALKPLPSPLTVNHFAHSNFARGIVTFYLEYIFRTDPDWDLIVTGPVNRFKENAQALSGVVETDWLPYPFTMNWQILRPGKVIFDEDEPLCVLYPVKKQALMDCQPEIHELSEDPELEKQFHAYLHSREDFTKRMQAGEDSAKKEGWLRHYFVGRLPDGTIAKDHINRLRLKNPVDMRPSAKRQPSISIEPPLKDSTVEAVKGGGVQPEPAQPRRSDPRWAQDSRLNTFPEVNIHRYQDSRRRFDQAGNLADREKIRIVRGQQDAADLDLIVVDELLSAAECDLLAAGRSDPASAQILKETERRIIQLTRLFYRLKSPLRSETASVERRDAGAFTPPRVVEPNGETAETDWMGFGGVCFLDDGAAGGELYFPAAEVLIPAKRGLFVGWTSAPWHEHGLTRVESGSQLLLSLSLQFEATKPTAQAVPLTTA